MSCGFVSSYFNRGNNNNTYKSNINLFNCHHRCCHHTLSFLWDFFYDCCSWFIHSTRVENIGNVKIHAKMHLKKRTISIQDLIEWIFFRCFSTEKCSCQLFCMVSCTNCCLSFFHRSQLTFRIRFKSNIYKRNDYIVLSEAILL